MICTVLYCLWNHYQYPSGAILSLLKAYVSYTVDKRQKTQNCGGRALIGLDDWLSAGAISYVQ
jgi:hypothetical protein